MIDDLKYGESLGSSDHVSIVFDYVCYVNQPINTEHTKRRHFYKGDYSAIREEIREIDWDELEQITDVNDTWCSLIDLLTTIIEQHIPLHKTNTNKKSNLNQQARQSIKNKHQTWQKYLHCNTPENWNQYKEARNLATKNIRKSEYTFEKDLAEKIATDPKLFWKHVRSKTKTNSSIQQVKRPNGELTKNNIETANIMVEFFSSVFVADNNIAHPDLRVRRYTTPLETVEFTSDEILKAIKRLKPNKVAGQIYC
ncbi:uncharacterized protein LOC117338570 [Pecten maximus]|uniref:uncharacterized protein LOC117338570 n=1 Tax=Pecten maximus TaxID=6579 RepID=UPI001458C21D|nr:uncharacterized protein LOC117338570 [Pecten maximus]